jgi:hypothetical protein
MRLLKLRFASVSLCEGCTSREIGGCPDHFSGGQTTQRKSNSGGHRRDLHGYLGTIQKNKSGRTWYFDELLAMYKPPGEERIIEGLALVVIEFSQLSAEDENR